MFTKLVSRTKYYSNYIFPILVAFLCSIFNTKLSFLQLSEEKAELLISVSSTFIGVLLTILTIYLAVPKSQKKIEQLKDSCHEHIYLANVLTGTILFFISIISWIFFDNLDILIITFISGISNIVISIYYTFSLIKYM